MIFRFDYSERTRLPSALSEVVYVLPASRERIKEALATGCDCQHDEPRTATLTRRNGAAWLQCDACGHSLGSAMRRDDHPKILEYPPWRLDLVDRHEAARQADREIRRAEIAAKFPVWSKEEREQEYLERSAEYAMWCRTSPEWAAIKKAIFWRSRGHCEACLNGSAEVVHHLTYEFGKLPPAWHLKAVCAPCHERLHCPGDDWCSYGMARE